MAAAVLLLATGVFAATPDGPPPCFSGPVSYVDAAAAGGIGDSWASPFTELQVAVDCAAPGTEIWVKRGTYKPTTGLDQNATFTLKDGVAVYGGFAGTETQRSQRDPVPDFGRPNLTTLSGDLGVQGDPSDNSLRVVTANAVGATTTLDGFMIRYGRNPGVGACGAGLRSVSSTGLTLRNLFFFQNSGYFGAGACVVGGAATLSDVRFELNSGARGAGLYATRDLADNGAVVTMARAVFRQNTTGEALGGAGMFLDIFTELTLRDCVFFDNSAGSGAAGAIFIWQGVTRIDNCDFFRNTAGTGGAAILHFVDDRQVTIVNSRFGANTGALQGGAIDNRGRITIVNSTFAANQATTGATIATSGGSTTIVNSTIWQGLASIADGGSSNTLIRNSLVAGGSPGTSSRAIVNDGIVEGGCPATASCTNVSAQLPELLDPNGADDIFGTFDDDYRPDPAGTNVMDRGNDTWLPTDVTDIDGDGNTAETLPLDLARRQRVRGVAVDLGALEDTPLLFANGFE